VSLAATIKATLDLRAGLSAAKDEFVVNYLGGQSGKTIDGPPP
jgi:hypothetical protein